ncbi:glycosyl hydrolase family 36 [Hydrogenispora ethanolica]|uniref:Glycosyl hydrolase family 36 n=1 Tax=Hydrogenispora ethanolica TaxID=1082276 RepID=A0A4V2QDR1_HYDET|nr:glycosyl hydrolase family 36 [Hydrogenispora ethanolica]
MSVKQLSEQIERYAGQYRRLKEDPEFAAERALPGRAYFLDDGEILSLPRDDGDCRYPYGESGCNFWAYTSGAMHCNDGLFAPFLRAAEGQEPRIAFFAGVPRAGGGYARVPLLGVPLLDEEAALGVERYTVFARNAAYYLTEWADFRCAVRVLVRPGREIIFTLCARNGAERARSLYLSSFLNPFLAHDIYENAEYRWFREVRVAEPPAGRDGLASFLITVNEDLSRTQSRSNYGVIRRRLTLEPGSSLIRHEETASRYQYVGGIRGNLNVSPALKRGSFGEARPVCAFTEVGAAGDILLLELGAGETARLDSAFWYGSSAAERDGVLARAIDCGAVERDWRRAGEAEAEKQRGLSAVVAGSRDGALKEKVWNGFFEQLKKQVEFCALIKGYVQPMPSSLIGIRDIFQALEGLVFWQPEAARAKMLEALQFVLPDGRCPRQYSLPVAEGVPPVMDLRPFIDQGAWIIAAVMTYLRCTADFSFLEESCGYYEIVDERAKTVRPSGLRDSVLDHLLRIVDYLVAQIDETTHCVHALYGDWNDALDGLGVSRDPAREYGTGVSVMVTLQLYQNLNDLIELLERVDALGFAGAVARYRRIRDRLRTGLFEYAVVKRDDGARRILHGWGDERSYLVGSFRDPDGQSRDSLTANAFWVLSQLYDEDTGLRRTILEAFQRLDSKYGLRTFAPHFERDAPGVGRIPKLPPGTAENGAAYVHASAFGIMALFRMGSPKQAWEQLMKSLPFTHPAVSCSPFVMPNSYGDNREKLIDGESMADWQTGSSNVIFKTLLRYVFGIEPHFDGVWIQPAAGLPWESFEFRIALRSCTLSIHYRNGGAGRRTFFLNGRRLAGVPDPLLGLEKAWLANEEFRSPQLHVQVND